MSVKERVYKNVKAIAALRGMKISDIEKASGVSVGYLSREPKSLGIEKLDRLAQVLRVTIGELTDKDLWEVYGREIAENELSEAIKKAAKIFSGCDILEIAARAIENK